MPSTFLIFTFCDCLFRVFFPTSAQAVMRPIPGGKPTALCVRLIYPFPLSTTSSRLQRRCILKQTEMWSVRSLFQPLWAKNYSLFFISVLPLPLSSLNNDQCLSSKSKRGTKTEISRACISLVFFAFLCHFWQTRWLEAVGARRKTTFLFFFFTRCPQGFWRGIIHTRNDTHPYTYIVFQEVLFGWVERV